MTHQQTFQENVTNINSVSPTSLDTMSPFLEHRTGSNGYQQTNINFQQHFISRNGINSLPEFTSSPPLKNSFCIDALLSKSETENNLTNDMSPESNRFLSDEDGFRKYNNERDYTPSPDGDTSR